MSSGSKKVAVVGGGVSGLATAYFIKKAALDKGLKCQVDIFEQENRPGGKFDVRREDGYTVEAGPNGFLDSKPWTLDLVRDLGMEDRLLPSDQAAARRFIYSRGKLHELKASILSFFMHGPMSVPGRLRIIGELWARQTPPGKDTSLAEFGRRRMGQEAVDRLLDPMVSGIFAGDPYRMSLRASFPRIAELEENYGGLTKAMLSIAREKKLAKKRGEEVAASSGPSGPGGVLTTFKRGTFELTDRLAEKTGERFHPDERVNTIQRNGDGWKVLSGGGEYLADAVVLATPSYVTAGILMDIAPESAALLEKIPYSPMAVIGLGYNLSDLNPPPNGFGYLIPSVEGKKLLGSLWDSSIFPGFRSDKDQFLIRAMVGGARDHETPFLSDEELNKLVLSELQQTMGLAALPVFQTIIRWKRAIPLYTVGHLERVAEAEERLPEKVIITGNAYRGVGINDCVREAETAALKLMEAV